MTTPLDNKRPATSNGQNRDEAGVDHVRSSIATLAPVVALGRSRRMAAHPLMGIRQRPSERRIDCGYLRDDCRRFRHSALEPTAR
jgi:hypothetical protein